MKTIKEKVVVSVDPVEEVTKSGIIIADVAKEKKQTGTVVAIGPDVKGVKLKDRVMFGKYSGSDIKVKDKEYLVFQEDDVLVVL